MNIRWACLGSTIVGALVSGEGGGCEGVREMVSGKDPTSSYLLSPYTAF